MRMFVACSDVYANLIEPHSIFVKKYWPELEVVFIGFTDARYKLEEGHSFVSAGEDKGPSSFSDSLIKVFSEIDDEYFVFNLEDMILMKPIDYTAVERSVEKIKNGVDKIMLYQWNPEWCRHYEDEFVILNQTSPYRASIHPAIWRRDYFLKCLKPEQSLWSFELQKQTLNDGATILAYGIEAKRSGKDYEGVHPYNLLHIYRGSAYKQENIDMLPQEDRDIIEPYLVKHDKN